MSFQQKSQSTPDNARNIGRPPFVPFDTMAQEPMIGMGDIKDRPTPRRSPGHLTRRHAIAFDDQYARCPRATQYFMRTEKHGVFVDRRSRR